ncbi:MAG: RDD family protein [Acidimicrobiales bacterium]
MADDEQEDEPNPSLPKPTYGEAPFYGPGKVGGSGHSGDSGNDAGDGVTGRTFGRVNGKQYHDSNQLQDGSNGSNQLQDGMFREDPHQSGPPQWGYSGGLGTPSGYGQQSGQMLQYPGPVDCLGRPCAPWWKRALAYILDILLINIVGSVVVSIVLPGKIQTAKNGLPVFNSHLIEVYVIEIVILLGYFALLDGSLRGQTVGKLALGIATRDAATGGQVGAARALARRFVFVVLFIAFILPGVLNALSPLWSKSWRAWHDSVGNTQVIRVR